jgi:hypothetical protein
MKQDKNLKESDRTDILHKTFSTANGIENGDLFRDFFL